MRLIFLGCSDEHGVPRVGCPCDVCCSIRSPTNPNYRTGPSVALHYGPSYAERLILIDAAPEFRLQVTRLGLSQFDALLLTHKHDVHILGLGSLIHAQRVTRRSLAVYAPHQVLEDVRERFGYLWTQKGYRRAMQPQAIGEVVDLWGLEARPLRVDHGVGGTAHGYVLTLGERRLAYIPDMLRATAEVRQALTRLDLLVIGAAHYHEDIDLWKRSVMDIMTALELIREVSPAQAILTHLSHTVDYKEITAKLPPQVRLAHDGLVVEVQE
jgi:phosphoribosyl 1,2-cyclic phosphate phosphodiesterase